MTRDDAINELKCAIDLIKQDGKDWLDERDIPLLNMAIKALEEVKKREETWEWCTDCKEYDHENHCCHRLNNVIHDTICGTIVNGEWISHEIQVPWGDGTTDVTMFRCSVCGYEQDWQSKFCPNCGAKMSESLKVYEIGKSLVDGIQAGIRGEKE